MRKKMFALLSSLSLIVALFVCARPVSHSLKAQANSSEAAEKTLPEKEGGEKVSVFESLSLGKLGLSKEAFDFALRGHDYLAATGKLRNENVLSIVDFSLPSAKKRLFIIDLKSETLLFHTYVSHGRGSGREMATEFSNTADSHKSSLGFYLTGDTYMGKHGFSMRLFGQDKGFNDNADSRAIVMHSAPYVSEEAIKMQGFIGRSHGCPAVSEALNKPIIEKIKNGSCLFIYSLSKDYAVHSAIINKVG